MKLQFTTAALVLTMAVAAFAQDPPQDPAQGPPPDHQHHLVQSDEASWTWTTDANVFYGYNYQQRRFADFAAWESQNWFMLMGDKSIGAGRLTINGMVSLEPLTINPQGSPQLYQTGESYQQAPLVNYQHPHDLMMAAGVRYRIEHKPVAYVFEADLVGAPALGPTAFMHRESARDNPQVPLTHHALDSTHITWGVLTAGMEAGAFTLEGSTFRGAEPDENRLNIETPRLDSWSTRLGWRSGPWQAQVSGGHLHEPEWFEPYDHTIVTASIGFDGAISATPFDATAAWGRTLEANGYNDRADNYLLEWGLRATDMNTLYGRLELVKKQVFGLGFHPKGFNHPHTYSRVDALTLGYIRELMADRWGRFGIGVDATLYRPSADLLPFFDSSHSYHFFLRWRPNRVALGHVH